MRRKPHPADAIGAPVYDVSGERLGTVDQVYYDDRTRAPKWLAIRDGLVSGRRVLVPGHRLVRVGGFDLSALVLAPVRAVQLALVFRCELVLLPRRRALHLLRGVRDVEPVLPQLAVLHRDEERLRPEETASDLQPFRPVALVDPELADVADLLAVGRVDRHVPRAEDVLRRVRPRHCCPPSRRSSAARLQVAYRFQTVPNAAENGG